MKTTLPIYFLLKYRQFSLLVLMLLGVQNFVLAQCDGGVIEGGPFEFCVDGEDDRATGITLSDETADINQQWVITDPDGIILGLPPVPDSVNFDAAGAGVCLIWSLSYEDGLVGLEGGASVDSLDGCFGFSNSITVTRTEIMGGILEGGPFYFCVDGVPDMVSGISLEGNDGMNNAWVITDDDNTILGLPEMPGSVDFDEAGPGLCLIWNLSYQDGLEGLVVGNKTYDLEGCFGLSNSVVVNRGNISGGTLEGGPFDFCVDGVPDMVSGITLEGTTGINNAWVVTDTMGNILGLPPMPGVVDFDAAGPGVCLIWNISYQPGLTGLEMNANVADLDGCYAFSNEIVVNRNEVTAGTLEGGPFEFCVDGIADMVSDITLLGNEGDNGAWVITDTIGNILGLPPMPGVVDFDEAGGGICLIWYISYADGLVGLEAQNNVADLEGCFAFSNAIEVVRNEVDGGTLEGGPFDFCVDGNPDMVSGITLEGNSGDNSAWVVTDTMGNILGLPPMPGVVDFDGAGPGVCLIWNISFQDGLTGLAMDENVAGLEGCFALSNSVTVNRYSTSGGTLEGGPFEFCVDGTPDMVSGITLSDNEGSNSAWVVTDAEGMILGLPPMPGAVDFDGAGTGICLIWNISFEDGLIGLSEGESINELEGCYGISNAISVVRTNAGAACDTACMAAGGILEGGPFEFCVDDTPDMVSGITLTGNEGTNSQWVITDAEGNVLGLPPMPGVVDFNEAGPGVCLIWNVSYEDDLMGLEPEANIFDGLTGCYSISNAITVTRTEVFGGLLEGGPFEFCVDGEADMVSGITLVEGSEDNNAWVVTDTMGHILGLPPMPGVVDFDGAGPGVCLIWNISYQDGLSGLEAGNNVADLDGCYGFSNPVEVIRNEYDGGVLEGGPFNFCIDGEADMVSGITLSGNSGVNNTWLVTDTLGNILGLPPMPGVVDFDEAGPGVCLIWNISSDEELDGLAMGNNVSDITGCYGLSNPVVVNRVEVEGGVLEGGPFDFCVDGNPDFVFGITLDSTSGNTAWVITDTTGLILGLPPMPGVVDFDEAGGGVCLIWNISFAGALIGLEAGNNVADIIGCYEFSNPVVVNRDENIGGEVIGQLDYEFCVDSIPDYVNDNVAVIGNSGENGQWVVVADDADGTILGLPDSPQDVDFNLAGPGVCLMGYVSYSDGLVGLEVGASGDDVFGCLGVSETFVTVERVTKGSACITSTDDAELFEFVKVYPNPTSGAINIEFEALNKSDRTKWSLLDGYGRTIQTNVESSSVRNVVIDTEGLTSGLYYIQIGNDVQSVTKRVSVIK